MKIFDQEHLLPNEQPIHRAIEQHPLHPKLIEWIEEVQILVEERKNSAGVRIEYDRYLRSSVLYLTRDILELPEYEYILLHEFTHVGDRIDQQFGYSDELRYSLSDVAQLKLMELWNVHIDSRLNQHGLFKLGEQDKGIYCMINGKLQVAPYTIEGKLVRHISFLRSRGMPEAEETIKKIWQFPYHIQTFSELFELAGK